MPPAVAVVRFAPAFVCFFVCLFVCLSDFLLDISKTNAARITKLDIETFYDEFWKPVYFVVKRSR